MFVHYGLAEQRLAARAAVLAAAYAAHPGRFPRGLPTPGTLPPAVWINKLVGCGCEEQNELVGRPRNADLEAPRVQATPDSRVMEPAAEGEILTAMAH